MIAVIGAGAWGTALALQLTKNDKTVNLWDIDSVLINSLQKERENTKYLPGIKFPDNLIVHTTLEATLKSIQDILVVVPSHAFQATLSAIRSYTDNNIRIAWGTKGLAPEKHCLLHELVKEILGNVPMAAISGPTFAKEVAMELPTAITIAANDPLFIKDMATHLHSSKFRVYTTEDLIGVEVGGATKNVLAIAIGASDGMKLGANARSALITRGLAELARLGKALGGKSETFMGLAGLGDLVLTCTDNQSRNRRFGLAIGNGKSVEQAKQEVGLLIEGISNAKAVFELAQQKQIVMPIVEQVYKLIYQQVSPAEAMKNLLSREQKAENC